MNKAERNRLNRSQAGKNMIASAFNEAMERNLITLDGRGALWNAPNAVGSLTFRFEFGHLHEACALIWKPTPLSRTKDPYDELVIRVVVWPTNDAEHLLCALRPHASMGKAYAESRFLRRGLFGMVDPSRTVRWTDDIHGLLYDWDDIEPNGYAFIPAPPDLNYRLVETDIGYWCGHRSIRP